MSHGWRTVRSDAQVVVLVGPDEPDPGDAVVRRLATFLVDAGLDAAAPWRPVTDALVRLDADGLVVEHLDRERYGRPGSPHVVSLDWWNRFRPGASAPVDEPPVLLVARSGGRVGVLDTSV